MFGTFMTKATCPNCKGKGKSYEKRCNSCNGNGKVKKQPTTYLDVKSNVVNDYTQKVEALWVENLRKKYQDRVIIYNDVLETLK